MPLLGYKTSTDSILTCQSQASFVDQLNVMLAYLTVMNINQGDSPTFESLRHYSQCIHLINYWIKTKHLPAANTSKLIDERTVFSLIQKNGLEKLKLDRFVQGYILYLNHS